MLLNLTLKLRNGITSIYNNIISAITATHVFTGTLLPTGTESLGNEKFLKFIVFDTGWNDNLDGSYTCDGSQTDYTKAQTGAGAVAKDKSTYEVTYEIFNYVSGSIQIGMGDGYGNVVTSNGIYTERIDQAGLGTRITARGDADFIGSIRSLSVKPVVIGLLKDTGKQKQNLTVNSGAMTLLNGVDQNIPAFLTTQNNSTAHSVSFMFKTNDITTLQYLYFSGSSTYNKSKFKWVKIDNGALIVRAGDISVNVLSLEVDKIYTYTDTYDGETLKVYINSTEVYSGLCTYVDTSNEFRWATDRNASLFPLLNISCGLLLPQALTPNQVKYLHDYPHKAVAHYNVNDAYTTPYLPDVIASLNMPLTEVGKYKIDYSKAFGVNESIYPSGQVLNDVSQNGTVFTINDPGNYYYIYEVIQTVVGKSYEVCFNVISNNTGNTGYAIYGNSTFIISTTGQSDYGTGEVKFIFTSNDTSTRIYPIRYISDAGSQGAIEIDNVSVRELTAYEVAEHTTSCNLTQQTDGLQMITYKQNNGILEKLQDDRMNFDGLNMTNFVDTGWIPDITKDFKFGYIQYYKYLQNESHSGVHLGGRMQIGNGTNFFIARFGNQYKMKYVQNNGYYHLFVYYKADSRTFSFTINGETLDGDASEFTQPTDTVLIGALNYSTPLYPYITPIFDARILLNESCKITAQQEWRKARRRISQIISPDGFDVFLLAGQSNMVGYDSLTNDYKYTNENIYQLGADSNTISIATTPLDHIGSDPYTTGLGTFFAKKYLENSLASGRKILLVPAAHGGTGFVDGYWLPGGTGYETAIAKSNDAIQLHSGNVFKGILWNQGEDDFEDTEEHYSMLIDSLIHDFRTKINKASNVPFVCATVPTWSDAYRVPINNAISGIPNRNNNCAVVDPVDLVTKGDNMHYNEASYKILGERYYDKFIQLEAN